MAAPAGKGNIGAVIAYEIRFYTVSDKIIEHLVKWKTRIMQIQQGFSPFFDNINKGILTGGMISPQGSNLVAAADNRVIGLDFAELNPEGSSLYMP